ncbi:MAG: FecR/PupR family sigma factor regulator, partial [Caenispirillum bisanense]|nr:FecR/PupR family sigma factor regulator [Caenispirillum bisanense]MCA1974966.1 FecR/PupR family sigma factor regulator [Caenispirillum sp.]
MTEDTTPPAARPATAEEWLVLLQDRPDDTALRADHRRWLAADPANAGA